MIVAETATGYQFVTQPAHAALAGRFADRWGNDRFDRPVPFGPVAFAAYAHDTGWHDYDRRPRLDGAGGSGDASDREPVDFRGMPAGTWVDLYESGIDAVAEADPYAGLLVSLHGAGLRNQRYGRSPEWPETPPAFEAFVEAEHERQRRLLDRLLADDSPAVTGDDRELLRSLQADRRVSEGYGGRIWADYRRLQAWDELSLAFCVTTEPPGYDAVGGVPTTGPLADATLSLARDDDGSVRVDPFPFDRSPVEATLPVRTVERTAFDDEASLCRAYYAAGRERRTVTLREGP
jgi:hypothetical protein